MKILLLEIPILKPRLNLVVVNGRVELKLLAELSSKDTNEDVVSVNKISKSSNRENIYTVHSPQSLRSQWSLSFGSGITHRCLMQPIRSL